MECIVGEKVNLDQVYLMREICCRPRLFRRTESGDPVKILGLALLNNPLEFEVMHELDYWAAAKAAHLWVRAEENEALRATTSYKLIQALAFELQQVAKKLEF
jgi:hypothetical protein